MDLSKLEGIIPPVATPLTPDQRLDEPGLRSLIRYTLDAGVHGLFMNGSTGEFPSLSDRIRHRALEVAVDETAGRVPILAGVTDTCLDSVKEHVQHAASAGADAIVISTPFYYKLPSQRSVVEFFRVIIDASPLPAFIYNVPHAVKNAVEPESVLEMSRWDKAAGIKDSSCDFIRFQEILRLTADNQGFRVFQGSEFITTASILAGAHGAVLGIANLAPRISVAAFEAARAGDVVKARELQAKLTEISQVWWMDPSSLACLKVALASRGLCGPTVALPNPPATEENARRIAAYVKEREDWI